MNRNSSITRRSLSVTAAVLVIMFFLTASTAKCADSASSLRAGAAKTDITPEKGVELAGYAARKELSTGVHDPLSARVIAFQCGGKRLVLVSTDILGFYNGTAEYMRRAILNEFELQPSELLLAAIHTHSAPTPTIDKEKGHPNNLEYTEKLKGKLVEVVGKALANTMPAQMGIGVGYCAIGANRREQRTNEAGQTSIVLGRNPYGPTDKEVLVMKVAKADGAVLAAAFDYATHATCLGGKNYVVSGDVLGLAEQFVEKILGQRATGAACIAPVFAGASGDIDPWFRVLPEFNSEPGWIPEPVLLGTVLGEEVVHVFRSITETNAGGEIKTAFATLELPAKPRKELTGENQKPTNPLNITVTRVGKVAFVGLGCEVLTEIGLAIKAGSPYKHTFVITHCNGEAGYLSPGKLHAEGGYEISSSPFAPEAADIVIKHTTQMLRQL